MEPKIKCWELSMAGFGPFVVEEKDLACFIDEIRGAEIGDEYEIKVVEHSREHLDALPEFEGF